MRWRLVALVMAAFLALPAVAGADPVRNPTSIDITAVCTNGQEYTFLVTPAHGRAVLDTKSTGVQLTFSITVSDPLNEVGGSFSTGPVRVGIPASSFTSCSGTVLGTQAVTYTATVFIV